MQIQDWLMIILAPILVWSTYPFWKIRFITVAASADTNLMILHISVKVTLGSWMEGVRWLGCSFKISNKNWLWSITMDLKNKMSHLNSNFVMVIFIHAQVTKFTQRTFKLLVWYNLYMAYIIITCEQEPSLHPE